MMINTDNYDFSNPYLLFGLFALLIPILIHLFNFRRYKTVYFSNVKMLDDIQRRQNGSHRSSSS